MFLVVISKKLEQPLVYGLTIPDYQIIDRVHEESMLKKIHEDQKIPVVIGGQKSGKTCLATKYAINKLKEDGADIIYIKASTAENIIKEFFRLTKVLKLPSISDELKFTMSVVFDYYKDKEVVFIFDDVINNNKFWIKVKSMIKDLKNNHIILLSKNTNWDPTEFELLQINNFYDLDVSKYVRSPEFENEINQLKHFFKGKIIPPYAEIESPVVKQKDIDINRILKGDPWTTKISEFTDPYEQDFPDDFNEVENMENRVQEVLEWERKPVSRDLMKKVYNRNKDQKESLDM